MVHAVLEGHIHPLGNSALDPRFNVTIANTAGCRQKACYVFKDELLCHVVCTGWWQLVLQDHKWSLAATHG
jgi:hypothetical protein